MSNSFEAARRAEKASLLIDVIDEVSLAAGLNPYSDADRIADRVAALTPEQWSHYSAIALVKDPSDTTVALIVSRYRARAERAARFQQEVAS